MVFGLLMGTGAEASTYTLQGITVNGDRVTYEGVSEEEQAKWLPGGYERKESNLGVAGDVDVMKAPYTEHSFSQKAMEQMVPANGSVDQILANVPSVKIGTSPIKTDFSVRGMYANGASMYINNIPGMFIMAQGPMANIFDRTDVLVGPASTLTGSVQSYNGPDGGQPVAVFLHTKRPDVNLNRIGISNSGYGDWGYTFDISRKDLGENGEWGVRAYGMYDDGGLAISGASRRRKNIFMDVEHKTKKSDTNLFAGTFDDRLWGTERRFTIDRSNLNKISKMPSAPDAHKSYDDPHYMHQFNYGKMLTLNHEQKINDHFDWFFNGGLGEYTTRRFIIQGTTEIDTKGNLIDTWVWSDYINVINRYAQLGFNAHFDTGAIHHDFTASIDRSYRKFYKNHTRGKKANGGEMVYGNMYTGIHFKPAMYSKDVSAHLGRWTTSINGMLTGNNNFTEMDTGLNLMDRMSYKKWNVMVAANRRHGNYNSASQKLVDDHWVPVYAVTYAPSDNLSFYGAYTKEATKGTIVSDDEADNYGEILNGTQMSQTEFGAKYKFGGMLATLAYFDVKLPQEFAERTGRTLANGNPEYHYSMNGQERYKGIDFNLSGKIAKKWNMFGGFEYLHARQEKTTNGKDGMPVDGSAKWNTVLGLEYKPNDDWSIMGRMNYTGHGVLTGTGRHEVQVPSYTTFDLFVNYSTHIGKTPAKFSFAMYNVFDHDHWVLQPGQGTKVMLDMPRTFMLSASFDF